MPMVSMWGGRGDVMEDIMDENLMGLEPINSCEYVKV